MSDEVVDWSGFDVYSESTCFCRCGAQFRSHTKLLMEPTPHLVSRKACPKCKKTDNLYRSLSDPEIERIG